MGYNTNTLLPLYYPVKFVPCGACSARFIDVKGIDGGHEGPSYCRKALTESRRLQERLGGSYCRS